MCDDLKQTLADLTTKSFEISRPVSRESWGLLASIKRTRGADLSIYQPRHRTAYNLDG